MSAATLAGTLADFVIARQARPFHESVAHDAKRLLLNQLKASAEACLQDNDARRPAGIDAAGPGLARVWWSGEATTPALAAARNRALLDRLDFGDTHLPSRRQLTAAILPMLLAHVDAGRHTGRRLLLALAIGLEVDIACATPGAEPPGGHQSGAGELPGVGATAACCTLLGLDLPATRAALARALNATANAPARIQLGEGWQFPDIAMHCRPAPVQALAPIDAALALRSRCAGREPAALTLRVSAPAWQLARRSPTLPHCVAATWRLGQFTTEERAPACVQDPAIRRLSERVEVQVDEASPGLQACSLSAQFGDGTRLSVDVGAFLGARTEPLSDCQLSELFRAAADDLVLPRRAGEILQALWGLDLSPDAHSLLKLLRRPG